MKNLFDWDKILATISVLAFIMSSATWIMAFCTQRKKLKITVQDYRRIKNRYTFFVMIENQSRLPISITRFFLLSNDGLTECAIEPTLIKENIRKSKGQIIETINQRSMPLPLNLSSLGALSGYVLFRSETEILTADATEVNFVIHTNRGKALQLKAQLCTADLLRLRTN